MKKVRHDWLVVALSAGSFLFGLIGLLHVFGVL